MKQLIVAITFLSLSSSVLTEPSPAGWRVEGLPDAPPFRLNFPPPAGEGTTATLDCKRDRVTITETGVTKMVDTGTGKIVGDDRNSTIPSAAANMALYVGRGDPHLVSATVHPNAVRGWDLTIEISKSDPAFLGLSKATAVSLMTTGMTGLIEIGPQDHKLIASFVKRCASK
ncbi:MAG TPA: hypothetical protein VII63_04370 [Caulobacteraceae bacterium]